MDVIQFEKAYTRQWVANTGRAVPEDVVRVTESTVAGRIRADRDHAALVRSINLGGVSKLSARAMVPTGDGVTC